MRIFPPPLACRRSAPPISVPGPPESRSRSSTSGPHRLADVCPASKLNSWARRRATAGYAEPRRQGGPVEARRADPGAVCAERIRGPRACHRGRAEGVRRGIQSAAQAGDLADERSARRGGEGGEDVDTVSVAAEARSSAGRARRDPSPGGG